VQRGGERRCLRGTASPQREADGGTLWHGDIEDVTELLALDLAQRDKQAAQPPAAPGASSWRASATSCARR
jgi:hypothetical protein